MRNPLILCYFAASCFIPSAHLFAGIEDLELSIQPSSIKAGQSVMVSWKVEGVERVYLSGVGLQPSTGSTELRPLNSLPINLIYTSHGVVQVKTQMVVVSGGKGNAEEYPSDESNFSRTVAGSVKTASVENTLGHFLGVIEAQGFHLQEAGEGDDRYVFKTSFRNADYLRPAADTGILAVREAYRVSVPLTTSRKGGHPFKVSTLIQTSHRAGGGQWENNDSKQNVKESDGLRAMLSDSSDSKKKFVAVKVFYATDRSEISPGKFGIDPSPDNKLTTGVSEVSIPHDHRLGEVERPLRFLGFEFGQNPSEHIVVLTVTNQSEKIFFSGVRSVAERSQGKQILVFIHGFNVGFEDALQRTAQIAYDLKFEGAPILYSWPSKGELGPLAYIRDERNAELSAHRLASFLRQLRAQSGGDTITLIAHSMGNRVLAQALNEMFNDKETGRGPAFRHIALMAPDIDAELFKQLATAIKSASVDITLYCSSKDEALMLAQTYAGYARAGQPLVIIPGIDTIDASAVDTSLLGAFHQYYADNQAIISDLFYLIRGDGPGQRARLRSDRQGNLVYWRFDPASR